MLFFIYICFKCYQGQVRTWEEFYVYYGRCWNKCFWNVAFFLNPNFRICDALLFLLFWSEQIQNLGEIDLLCQLLTLPIYFFIQIESCELFTIFCFILLSQPSFRPWENFMYIVEDDETSTCNYKIFQNFLKSKSQYPRDLYERFVWKLFILPHARISPSKTLPICVCFIWNKKLSMIFLFGKYLKSF